MNTILTLQQRYPHAHTGVFGDALAMDNELATLTICGGKQAICCSLASYILDEKLILLCTGRIILNDTSNPVCVIRTLVLRPVRFCDVTPEKAEREGEVDKSPGWWRESHQDFFARKGIFATDMELLKEEFALVESLV